MRVRIYVTFKPEIADPQGEAIKKSLHHLGFGDVTGTHYGKIIDLELTQTSDEINESRIVEMCEKLLVDLSVEDYKFECIKT